METKYLNKYCRHTLLHMFKTVFIWDRRFWLTVILTESKINLVWSYSAHCVVLSWVALLTARLLHFYQWRPSSTVARASVRTPVSTLLPGKQDIWVWQWTLKRFDIYIFLILLTKITFLFKSFFPYVAVLKRLQNYAFIFIKRVIIFWK